MLENPAGLQIISVDSSGSVELFAFSKGGQERVSVIDGYNDGEIFSVSMPALHQLGLELGCVLSKDEIIEGFQNAVEGIPVPILFEITWAGEAERTTIKSNRK